MHIRGISTRLALLAAGAVVLAPLLLALRQHASAWRNVTLLKWMEAATLYSALAMVLHILFTLKLPTMYLALPLVLWAAVRLGMLGTTLFMFLLMLFMVRYNALGLGPYGVLTMGRLTIVLRSARHSKKSGRWEI